MYKLKLHVTGVLLCLMMLIGCAGRHTNNLRMDVQLKGFNYFEAEMVLDSTFAAADRLLGCKYFSKEYPEEFRRFARLIFKRTLDIESKDLSKRDACATATMFGKNISVDPNRLIGLSTCKYVDHTMAHEFLHLAGLPHGIDLNTVLLECGLALPKETKR